MARFEWKSAGESHGRALLAVVEGIPAGLPLSVEPIDRALARRQKGYGRGGRMKIERDRVEILSGVRHGSALGFPIALLIENKDWANWEKVMSALPQEAEGANARRVTRPRPGHADLAGGMKWGQRDLRNVLERASARETAARVAVGGVATQLLEPFGIRVVSQVVEIGGVSAGEGRLRWDDGALAAVEASELRCSDGGAEAEMRSRIDEAKKKGDTVGGLFEVRARGVPPGLGSFAQWDERLDGRLAMALMSIQAMKGVEIGAGFEGARRFGSEVHDAIYYEGNRAAPGRRPWGFYRKTNRAGGLEGGITNGEEVVIRVAMKPISTLMNPLASADIESKRPSEASVERSDYCAVPAASVVGEAMTAIELARAFLEKFGGDSLSEVRRSYEGYLASLASY